MSKPYFVLYMNNIKWLLRRAVAIDVANALSTALLVVTLLFQQPAFF